MFYLRATLISMLFYSSAFGHQQFLTKDPINMNHTLTKQRISPFENRDRESHKTLKTYLLVLKHETDFDQHNCGDFFSLVETELWNLAMNFDLRATSTESCSEPTSPFPGAKMNFSIYMLVSAKNQNDRTNLRRFLKKATGIDVFGKATSFELVRHMIRNVTVNFGLAKQYPRNYELVARDSAVFSFENLPAFLEQDSTILNTVHDGTEEEFLQLLDSLTKQNNLYRLAESNVVELVILELVISDNGSVHTFPNLPVIRDCGVSSGTKCYNQLEAS